MKVHFLGIGGAGASAVAAIAQGYGYQVSGCDKQPNNEFTQVFNPNQLSTGHSDSHLEGIDILAITPAIFSLDPNNEEIKVAREKGIEVLTWQQFMGKYLEKEKFVIAVCGTHGKSTTTAMIGLLLEEAGLDPTVEIGAIIPKWGINFRIGKGKYFVTESDEFNDNFLPTTPDIAVVTSIEYEHPEYFKDFDIYKESFRKFLGKTKEKIIANLSDGGVADVISSIQNDKVIDYSKQLIDFHLQIPGEFNKYNASAVYQVGLSLGIDPAVIKKSLESFTGVGRRFEKIGEYNSSEVFSDFGHHPTEVKLTIEAARVKFPDKKITVIFQPHMFTRTKALFDDFVEVFKNLPVDEVIILDIYPSREADLGLVNSKQLVEAIGKDSVKYISKGDEVLNYLKKNTNPGEILFFQGAGDTDKLAKELVKNE